MGGVCNSKTWLNIADNATNASIAITCSDTAINTTTCTAAVANCEQSMCYTLGATATLGCRLCSSGYKGGATSVTDADGIILGYTTCTAGSITNAEYYNVMNNAQAGTCKSGYAVANAATSCVAFTTDSNCRSLGTGDTYCGQCWYAYYFSLTVCTLSASLMTFGAAVAVVLSMF